MNATSKRYLYGATATLCLALAGCSETHDLNEEDARSDASSEEANGTCEYNGRTYKWGDTFCAEDGCNTCGCDYLATPCTAIACIYPEAGLDAGMTRCAPGEIIPRNPPECEGRPRSCVSDVGNGCCGDVEVAPSCESGAWTCMEGMKHYDTCIGFGPFCGDAGVLPNPDSGT